MTVYAAKAKFTHIQPKFKIFYDNGTTYDNKSGPLDRAHKQGVIAIIVEDKTLGQRIETDCDFYCYFPHGWTGVSQSGLFDYLSSPGSKLVLFGRIVDSAKRETIFKAVENDTHIQG